MEVKELKPLEPKSSKAVVELLRGYLDKAFSEKIEFLEITIKIKGETSSISIADL